MYGVFCFFFKGKVEMTIKLISEEEGLEIPGKARDKPNYNPKLDEPKYVNNFHLLLFIFPCIYIFFVCVCVFVN